MRLVTAADVKRWLYRCISGDASNQELFEAGADDVRPHFEALDQLANYVQQLPDDDERFIRLADAGLETDGDRPTSCLASRCANFGPGWYFGNDPDAWLTEYSRSECSMVTRHARGRESS
jgi:hypothetical protein